jgi:hypothetical protein
MVRQRPPTVTGNGDPAPGGTQGSGTRPVKRSAGWLDVTGMVTHAQPALTGNGTGNWIVEQITATQQMGTHLDGLNHLQEGDRTYNGSLTRNIHRLDPVPPLSAHNLPLCDRCAQPVTARRVPTGNWDVELAGPRLR